MPGRSGSPPAATNISLAPLEELDADSRRYAYAHYNMIAGVLPFIGEEKERSMMIGKVAEMFDVSKQTTSHNLCMYLAYQNISALAPRKCNYERPLTKDEKNIRWALNKYFYTPKRHSLQLSLSASKKKTLNVCAKNLGRCARACVIVVYI